jgi:hypothetical protein
MGEAAHGFCYASIVVDTNDQIRFAAQPVSAPKEIGEIERCGELATLKNFDMKRGATCDLRYGPLR